MRGACRSSSSRCAHPYSSVALPVFTQNEAGVSFSAPSLSILPALPRLQGAAIPPKPLVTSRVREGRGHAEP